MITSHGPVGTSGMTAAAATKRLCTRTIDFTALDSIVVLGYISTNITVTDVQVFIEEENPDGTVRLSLGVEVAEACILDRERVANALPRTVMNLTIANPDVDGGHMLMVTVSSTDSGGKGQLAIEYHERE